MYEADNMQTKNMTVDCLGFLYDDIGI